MCFVSMAIEFIYRRSDERVSCGGGGRGCKRDKESGWYLAHYL